MEKIELNDVLDLHEAVKQAREDDTPYAFFGDEEDIAVVGDANKTEEKKVSFSVLFRFKKEELKKIPENAKIIGNFVMIKQEYEEISMPSKKDDYMIEAIQDSMPFFTGMDKLEKDFKNKLLEAEKKYNSTFKEQFNIQEDNRKKNMIDEGNKLYSEFMRNVRKLYGHQSMKVINACYDIVAYFIDIDDALKDHMTSRTVMSAMLTIISNYGYLFNNAEAVFGS